MDKSIIPKTPIEKPRSVPAPGGGFGEKENVSPTHNRYANPYAGRAFEPKPHGASSFPADAVNLSQHYGAPHEEVIKKTATKVGTPKEKSQISRREFIRKLEGHTSGTAWRKELAKRLGIGSIFDPRVTKQVEKMVEKVKNIYGDDLISKYEFKKALGGVRHGRHFEELHHKQERLSDGKITLEERRERNREEIGHGALHDFADEMFGSEHEE